MRESCRYPLRKIKNHWYVLDDSVEPSEGGISFVPFVGLAMTSFVDTDYKICSTDNPNLPTTVYYDRLNFVTVMASTNPNDGTSMLNMNQVRAHLGLNEDDKYPSISMLCDYTITFSGGRQSAYVMEDGFINILRVKLKSD